MKQKEIIKHMKNGAQLNVWLEDLSYKGTLTIDNGDIVPEVIASLTDKQIDSLLKYDFIELVDTVYPDHKWFVQHFKYKEE